MRAASHDKTQIEVYKGSGNVFADLGLPNPKNDS